MPDLSDPEVARAIVEMARRVAREEIRRLRPDDQYGIVASVDTATMRASVYLNGSETPTPNFVYPRDLAPLEGERVRVRMRPGDYTIERVLLATHEGEVVQPSGGARTSTGLWSLVQPGRVKVVDVLPALPDAAYPIGQIVLLTTDEKLYRNVDDDQWTRAIDGGDLTGNIDGTLILPESIDTPQLNANAVKTEQIEAGAVKADQIYANAVTLGKIDAGAVTAECLAGTIVLGEKKITTGLSGARVELTDDGIVNYDASENVVFKAPTTSGDPVEIAGKLRATDKLTAETGADLYGTNALAGGAVMTLEVGISTPTVAPTLTSSLPEGLGLTTAPPYVGHGISYDGTNTSYWIGANPTTGNLLDMAYEYDTDGTLLRTIRKTGTESVATATVPSSPPHVADRANGYVGDTDSAFAIALTLPSDRGACTITKVGVWMAGREGTCDTRAILWNSSGTMLRESATFTAADKGATGIGDSVNYNRTLSSPYTVSAGTTVRVGYARMNDSDGSQHDVNTGSYTTYIGDGNNGDMTGVRTVTTEKPNFYLTYEYTIDSSEEGTTGKIIGVVRVGTTVFCLDANGFLFRYNEADLDYLGKVDLSAKVTGTKANAGLMYDGTNLVITTTVAASGSTNPKLVKLNATTGAWVSDHTTSGWSVDGAVATVRGGYYASSLYWLAIVNGTSFGVRPFDSSASYAYVSNRDFGLSGEMSSGITHDGTQFRGYSSATASTIHKYTNWDWTDSNAYYVGYAWYDSAGTTHETALSPKTMISLGRRRQLNVTTPALPGGGGDDPVDKVRVYMERAASLPTAGTYHRQTEDATTTRTLQSFSEAANYDSTSNTFPAGSSSQLKSAATGWTLKGNGLINRTGTSFPSSPVTGDQFFRSDLGMEFFYDGTRWLSTQLFLTIPHVWSASSTWALSIAATQAGVTRWLLPPVGSSLYIEKVHFAGYVNSGGSALSASHKWTYDVGTLSTANVFASLSTAQIQSGSDSTWLVRVADINSVINPATYPNLRLDITKTGTPGTLNISSPATLQYRIVAT